MVATERASSDHVDKVAGILLAGWGSFDKPEGGERWVSDDKIRQAVRT
jgi:hypothetical protein